MGGRTSSSSENPPKTVVEAKSRSAFSKNIDEEWIEYALARTAIYIVVYTARAEVFKEK